MGGYQDIYTVCFRTLARLSGIETDSMAAVVSDALDEIIPMLFVAEHRGC